MINLQTFSSFVNRIQVDRVRDAVHLIFRFEELLLGIESNRTWNEMETSKLKTGTAEICVWGEGGGGGGGG